MFASKILTTLIGTGVAASLVALPVRAKEDSLTQLQKEPEINISQINYGYSDRNIEPSDDFKNIVGLTGLAIGTGVIAYHLRKGQKPSWGNLPNTNSGSNGNLLTRVKPKLRHELLRLVHNQATAIRLMNGTSISHPGRSANWVAEKVIYDLKRDR